MICKIKTTIEKELVKFGRTINRHHSLTKISPLLSKEIKNFMLRKGKRLRPILFVLTYKAFSKKCASGLYTSALSLELLHDFLIIHDDIIDKSDMRRGKPSMHKKLNDLLSNHKNAKFNGQDLSIVIADIIYAMSIRAFLSINEDTKRKEKALKRFIEAAIYTGGGEFIELLNGLKNIENVTEKDIYKIYDLKTSYYSFAYPLSTGATLAGASQDQIKKLFGYGMYLGRAFQIKDDILGLFGEEKDIGKSSLTDLQEGRKTILVWWAYKNSNKKDKLFIKKVLSKNNVNRSDLLKMRGIVSASGTLDRAKKEISGLLKKSENLILSSGMRTSYKNSLSDYSKELLKL